MLVAIATPVAGTDAGGDSNVDDVPPSLWSSVTARECQGSALSLLQTSLSFGQAKRGCA